MLIQCGFVIGSARFQRAVFGILPNTLLPGLDFSESEQQHAARCTLKSCASEVALFSQPSCA
jgi:hypothetical protein